MPDEEKNRYDRDLDIYDYNAAEMASRASRFDRMVEDDLEGLLKALKGGASVIVSAVAETRHLRARVSKDSRILAEGVYAGVDAALLSLSECLTDALPADSARGPEVPVTCDPMDQWILDGGTLHITGGPQFRIELRGPKGTKLERVGGKSLKYQYTSVRRSVGKDLYQILANAWVAEETVESTIAF